MVEEVKVEGRKFPLKDLRARLLNKQEQYMHLFTNEKISKMELNELQAQLQNCNARYYSCRRAPRNAKNCTKNTKACHVARSCNIIRKRVHNDYNPLNL